MRRKRKLHSSGKNKGMENGLYSDLIQSYQMRQIWRLSSGNLSKICSIYYLNYLKLFKTEPRCIKNYWIRTEKRSLFVRIKTHIDIIRSSFQSVLSSLYAVPFWSTTGSSEFHSLNFMFLFDFIYSEHYWMDLVLKMRQRITSVTLQINKNIIRLWNSLEPVVDHLWACLGKISYYQ